MSKTAENRYRRRWTHTEDEFLCAKKKAGWSYEEIGISLKRTRSSVQNRVAHLKATGSPAPDSATASLQVRKPRKLTGLEATLSVKMDISAQRVAEVAFEPSTVDLILGGMAEVTPAGICVPGVLTIVFSE